MHDAPTKRATWAENAVDNWYIRTSPEHYRCHIIYAKQTRSTRISNTVWFKHKYITQPTVTPADMIVKAMNDLAAALKGKSNQEGLEELETLKQLEELLTNQVTEEKQSEEQQPTNPAIRNKQVQFNSTTKLPNKTKQQPTETSAIAEPRVLKTKNSSVRKAAIDKPMTPKSIKPTGVPIARVHRRQHFDTGSHRRIPQ